MKSRILRTTFLGLLGLVASSCTEQSSPDTDPKSAQEISPASVSKDAQEAQSVAILFVGHGEPATYDEGTKVERYWDNTLLGPSGVVLGVPAEEQATIWAAAYEEIATAVAYESGDLNGNGVLHEVKVAPEGDVPSVFVWPAFKDMVRAEYSTLGDSPHNGIWINHVANTPVDVSGAKIDSFLAFMDAKPFVVDKIHEITQTARYKSLVVVPLLLSQSTHTQEIRELVAEGMAKAGRDLEIAWAQPFFDEPYVRALHASAVADHAKYLRTHVPAEVQDSEIGVVLGAHGDPYKPPYADFGWKTGDIYSNLLLTEDDFAAAVAAELPWTTVLGVNEFRPPTVEAAISQLASQGKRHILVVPTVFPTACAHTMFDIANKSMGRPVPVKETVASRALDSGTTVWYTPLGYGDTESGAAKVRAGMRVQAKVALTELFEKHRFETPAIAP